MKEFCATKGFRGRHRLVEGTPDFEDFRDCLLREGERSLFLSAALMRWSLNLFAESASYWIQTTLYYSGFFAAKSILATQGGWFDGKKWLIENVLDQPGKQEFEARKVTGGPNSHEQFWDEYYPSVAGLGVWLGGGLSSAVSPVNGDARWLTRIRNNFNYTPARAFEHMAAFKAHFAAAAFPNGLHSDLAIQFEVSRSLLDAAFKIAKLCGLKTDVIADRNNMLETTIFNATAADLGTYLATMKADLLA